MNFLEKARALEARMTAWRRDIHQHPELGFTETRTAQLVADTLRGLGIDVQTNVGRTGVVGRLGSGRPAVGIRADMDALPVQEANDLPYASQTPGLMHACGHDGHTAILMGVATLLSQMPDRPAGEIRFLFQPCEEGSVCRDEENFSGAGRMIQDCALEGLDAVIALHVASEAPVGVVIIDEGYIHAAVDTFYATIRGVGCHGAYPHQGVDPIYLLGHVIHAVQGIRSRRLKPTAPSVVTIGSVHGGSAPNVIPAEIELTGTIRSFDEHIREQIHAELHQAFSVTRALGGDYDLRITTGAPALYNDPGVAQAIREVSAQITGPDKTLTYGPSMGAEDFALMTRAVPGAMFHLGAAVGDVERPHHSPIFNIDERAFPIGAAILAQTACRLLETVAPKEPA